MHKDTKVIQATPSIPPDANGSFEAYLKKKRIDPTAFRIHDSFFYHAMSCLFDQLHEHSFTQQKLFLINNLRKHYWLKSPNT